MDTTSLREFFPTMREENPVTYLDNACMTLRPDPVIEAITRYYSTTPSCAGRSVHRWGMKVSQQVARARRKMGEHIGAPEAAEVIFTRNTTESINRIARGLQWNAGDVVLTSDREHNSNLIPWLQTAQRDGIVHRIVDSGEMNRFDLEAFEDACAQAGDSLRLVSLVHVSNLDGVEIPIKEATKIAHDHGALVHVDAAQSVPHMPVDVCDLDVDLLSFSIHKMMGPTGMGVLWGRREILEELDTSLSGGGTIASASSEGWEWAGLPQTHEGGLQHYAGIVGTEAALDFISTMSMADMHAHEVKLNQIISDGIRNLPGVEIIGPPDASERGGICSVLLSDLDVHNVGILMDEMSSVFVRSGLHCVNHWFETRDILDGSLRASVYAYNTEEEARLFVDTFSEIVENLS